MIRSVVRALAIFDAFDKDHLSLPLHEIGHRIGMPKATTYRLVNTLETTGFLLRLENQHYCLSHKLTRLAGLVLASVSLRSIARPIMREVNRLTGETITLNLIDGVNRMCIDVVDTPSPLMSIARPGDRVPLLLGATSRILLAYMSEDERDRTLSAIPEATQVDRPAIERELKRFRRQGYAITRSQRIQGVTAIGVPIVREDGSVNECLALTGPSARVDRRDGDFIEIMVAAGRDLSKRMGGAIAALPPDTTMTKPSRKTASAKGLDPFR
jgi:DNA-binding IclR family transcriptional regulator